MKMKAMKKKEYITPSIDIIAIHSDTLILTQSDPPVKDENGDEVGY